MAKMGRPTTITGPIAELADKVGGVKALAAQVNVDPRTIRYWASKNRNPSGPARRLLLQISEQHGVKLDVIATENSERRKVDEVAE